MVRFGSILAFLRLLKSQNSEAFAQILAQSCALPGWRLLPPNTYVSISGAWGMSAHIRGRTKKSHTADRDFLHLQMLEAIALDILGGAVRHLPGYLVTLCLTTCLFLCIRSCWQWERKEAGPTMPPGPRGIPLLGNLPILRSDFYRNKSIEWGKKYGPVFRRLQCRQAEGSSERVSTLLVVDRDFLHLQMLEAIALDILGGAVRHLPGYLVTLCLTTCLFLCIRSCWQWERKEAGPTMPPGPRGIPLLGNLPILRSDFYRNKSIEWGKKYGPVFSVKLGVQSMVIVNDFQLIKEILCKKECLFRPRTWVFKDVGGIASLNGKAWQENRRYCVKTLRELSSGRKSMLEQVREEFQYLREKVSETKGHPVMVRPFLLPCVTNNIAALLLGSRYDFNDPRLNRLDTLLEAFLRIFSGVSPVDPLPKCLKWIAPYIHCLGGGNGLELQQKFFKFIRNEINDRLETVDSDINPHFIKGYLALVTQHNENPKSNINARALHGNMVDILVAGSASVAASILYILLYCAEKPDTVQAKIQEEIDRVVGYIPQSRGAQLTSDADVLRLNSRTALDGQRRAVAGDRLVTAAAKIEPQASVPSRQGQAKWMRPDVPAADATGDEVMQAAGAEAALEASRRC
ncbi:hypothetical protein ISCGN_007413 [Ixodes scapularis]